MPPLVNFGAMLNDRLNICVPAAFGHAIQIWTYDASSGTAESTLPDATIQAFYSQVSGYNPSDPTTDKGTDLQSAIADWEVIGIGGYRLAAAPFVLPTQFGHVKQAINLFGVMNGGLSLPISAYSQIASGIWTVPPGGAVGDGAPGSWGLHDCSFAGYDPNYLYFITWGIPFRMTWQFWETYGVAGFALVSKLWLKKNGVSPIGLNLAQLLADARSLGA